MQSSILDVNGFKYEVFENGDIFSFQKKKMLSKQLHNKGYLQCSLWNGKSAKHYYIHRLVAQAFIANPENKSEINHIDGDKTNNHISNLEWVTRAYNMLHAREIGLFDDLNIQVEENQKLWIGLTNSTRKIIGVTRKKNKVGNYKVLVQCRCSHELEMYFNDFQKDKHKHCIKCRPKSSYLPKKYSGE